MPDLIDQNFARLGITYNGQYGDLPDPVRRDATDADIFTWASEAIRSGSVPGIRAQEANLTDYVVDRFDATADRNYNLIQLRPKTPFGIEIPDLNRRILQGNIERMTASRPLNAEALKRAVDIAETAFKGTVTNGEASRIGLETVEREIYKSER